MRLFLLALLCPVLSSLELGCARGENSDSQPPFKPMADVKELMVSVVDPAADVLWDSVGTVITEEGVDDWYPVTEEEWAEVRNAAVVLMESGNLLMIGDRARDQEAWMAMCEQMVDAGAAALEAAESKDPDAVFAVGEQVYFACDRCHNLYWVGDEQRRPVGPATTSTSERSDK